ncbi:MAG: ATP-binding protein [Lacibacter sp.]
MPFMQSIRFLLQRYGYLLLAAAWLFTLSFLVQYYWSRTATPAGVQRQLETALHKRETDFENFIRNTSLLTRLTRQQSTEQDVVAFLKRDYAIFLTPEASGTPRITAWNTQLVQPDAEDWNPSHPVTFQKRANGYYLLRCNLFLMDDGSTGRVLALIPVQWDYFVTTYYLNNNFAYVSGIEKNYAIAPVDAGGPIIRSKQGAALFSLQERTQLPTPLNTAALLLRIASVIAVLLFVQRAAVYTARTKGRRAGIAVLFVCLLLLRVITYIAPFPVNFRLYALFDPSVYGSNIVLKSLGDLLLNALLVLWILLFAFRGFAPQPPGLLKKNWVAATLYAVGMVAITFLLGAVVRSLVIDSNISFQVTDFFSLNSYSFIGFFVLGCIAAIAYLLFQFLSRQLYAAAAAQFWPQLLLLVVPGFVYLTLRIGSADVLLQFSLLLWLVVLWLLLPQQQFQWLKPATEKPLFWLFFFASSFTLLLAYSNNRKEQLAMKRMAEKLSVQTDPAAENLLSIALTNFRGDFLRSDFYRFRSPLSSRILKDSLLGEHFSGYLNKYDTRIYTYSADEQPLYNDDSTSFNTLNTIYNLQSKPTSVKDWRFYEESFDRFYYIARREVAEPQSGNLQGYLFVVAKPGRYTSEKFSPDLFTRQYGAATGLQQYTWAVYKNKLLVNSYNDYAFPAVLPHEITNTQGFRFVKQNGYRILWYVASGGRAVAVAEKSAWLLETVTLFAYLFFIFLLQWALLVVGYLLSRNRLHASKWRRTLQMSFRAQVHAILLFITIVSFVVIGVSTIVFFINRHERTYKERLSRTIQIMKIEVERALRQHEAVDDFLKLYDAAAADELQMKINRISDIHGVDVNVYDPDGNLQLSSQPYYYNKGLLNRKMNPYAFYEMTQKKLVQTVQYEQVGTRRYMSMYVPVRNEAGLIYAYLNIPYFTSQNELRQEISSFLVTLINLNAFIFLIAGLIAYLVTNRITASFSIISDRMRQIRLGKPNAPIVWNRNDEIGALVQQYNKMVQQLEESARLLAKSEREGAWREMARQVAHEIKNPLTPMKLSIQYLQKAIDANAADAKTIARNVAKTLVEQIDYLSNIASDFSHFANIANPRLERVDLNASIQSVADLFTMDQRVQIQLELTNAEPLWVMGDKTHLNRLFTNLIRNAIEAVPPHRNAVIRITLTNENNDSVRIRFADNGSGIPADVQDRIFYPNFTTKSSGTGLGLAMCKGIVEQMKGAIWFETRENAGTTFFIRLPLLPADAATG